MNHEDKQPQGDAGELQPPVVERRQRRQKRFQGQHDLRFNVIQGRQAHASPAWLQYGHSCFEVPHVCSQRHTHI